MAATPHPPAEPHAEPHAASSAQKPYWLYRLAAWVGVVAGIVFIVGAVFAAGAYVSRDAGHRGCPMMRQGHSMQHGETGQDGPEKGGTEKHGPEKGGAGHGKR